MRNLLLFLLLLSANGTRAQSVAPPVEYSQNEKLSIDAYNVFKTNKFLDFKDRDTLLETIGGVVYKSTNLNRYFSNPKDWNRILAEDTSSYRRPVERYPTTTYQYSYTDTSMTESHDDYNPQYDLKNAWKKVYNLKGFITYSEKNTFIKGELVQIRNTTNTFDAQNRVLKIVEKEARAGGDFRKETITQAVYAGNTVTVSSGNGTMVCRFISDGKGAKPVSNLSSRQTADAFMDALGRQQIDLVQTYCTVDLAKRMRAFAIYHYEIEKLNFQKGSVTLTANGVTLKDIWKMRLKGQEERLYEVDFELLKAASGWKIDDFDFRPKK